MRSTMKYWKTLACASALSLLGACAEGSPSEPPTYIEPPVPPMEDPCGNGVFDPGVEECDCPASVSTVCPVMDMDCTAVGRGPGVLLCNAAPQCTFNYTMCQDSTPATGGTGAVTGTGGTGR